MELVRIALTGENLDKVEIMWIDRQLFHMCAWYPSFMPSRLS